MSTALAKQVPLRGQAPLSGGVVDQSPVSSDSSQNEKSDLGKGADTTIHTHRLTDLSCELGAPADEKRFWWQRVKTFGMRGTSSAFSDQASLLWRWTAY